MADHSIGQDERTQRGTECLLVSQVFPPVVGGSGVLLMNVYSRMGRTGVTVFADVPSLDPGPGTPLRVVTTRFSEQSWGLLDPRGWRSHVRLARAIYRHAAGGRAIVHCGRSQPEAVPALLARLVPGGPPYIFWAHGEDITAAMSSRQYGATLRFVHRNASGAIANSHNTARMVRDVGWYRGPVHVVYPGVDAARFQPGADDGLLRRQLAPNGELLLLSVSRLQKRKGHELVLGALPELMTHIPRIRYVIVGAGEEHAALEASVAAHGLQGHVQFEGEVAEDRLPAYFSACDVFVLPTRVEPHDFEGFGIVYLEAAAAGKPTIGGRNGGVPEAVLDGQTGLLVSGEDVHELATALRALCDSADLRHRLGDAGRVRAMRDFTWERAAAQVREIHENLARTMRQPSRSAH